MPLTTPTIAPLCEIASPDPVPTMAVFEVDPTSNEYVYEFAVAANEEMDTAVPLLAVATAFPEASSFKLVLLKSPRIALLLEIREVSTEEVSPVVAEPPKRLMRFGSECALYAASAVIAPPTAA